ncbi:hypothetical protein, unknown function [Leishmania tarentolae]|uniref:Mitochondrial import inner membrane translocase subunit TIM50 n=1 Tax=Leishmania tarentolae TaxID=5689 RepID=A0A640KTM9_LEITA|nr:hypothetical protein, unknown function [Leishmania tarentolae]
MPTCTSIAATGQCQPCASAVVPTASLRPQLSRSKILGVTGNAYNSVHLRPLREVPTLPFCDAHQRARNRHHPTDDATLPHHRKKVLSARVLSENHSSLNSMAHGELHRKSGGKAPYSSPGTRCNSAPVKEAATATTGALPRLSPMKVEAVETIVNVSTGVTSAATAHEIPFTSSCALRNSQRLSNAQLLDRRQSSDSDFPIVSSPRIPSLYATEEELPVYIDPEGVQCCPLLDSQCEKGVLQDSQINLSPFFNWKFVPYLPPQAKDKIRPTVVLDMDETLLHTSVVPMPDTDAEIDALCPSDDTQGAGVSTTTARYKLFVKYRPHLERFLLFCLDHFEVVIFTASKALYAQAVLRQLQKDFPSITIRLDGSSSSSRASASQLSGDETRVIELLHRDHCTPTNVGYTKDLHLLGRDLRRTILVDNNKVCGVFQPYNSVHVKDFARRRCTEHVPEQQRMRATQLRQLKEAVPASAMAGGADVDASLSQSNLECTTSTYDWVDRDDTVLLRLCATGGLLHRLSHCENVPSFMQRTVCFNRAAH